MRYKTNVSYVSAEYQYENNKIVCGLTYIVKLDKYPLNEMTFTNDVLRRVGNAYNKIHCLTDPVTDRIIGIMFKTTGTAKCDPVDEYNKRTGENIALTRAQGKAFEKTCRVYDALLRELDKTADNILKMIENNYETSKKCWDHNKELSE